MGLLGVTTTSGLLVGYLWVGYSLLTLLSFGPIAAMYFLGSPFGPFM